MPYLGDYLGHLLSEVTLARVQADLESLRVAELYATDNLLRHFPVPHFRLPAITVDVPVAIKEVQAARAAESPRGKVSLAALKTPFNRILQERLKHEGVVLSTPLKKRLSKTIDETLATRGLARPSYVAVGVKNVANELTATAIRTLREDKALPPETISRLEKIGDDIRDRSLVEFLRLVQPPPRLSVLVTTAELREAGPPELLAKVHLTLSEEAVEWTVIQSNGKSIDRLVPE